MKGARDSSCCADCHRSAKVGVEFEVKVEDKVFRWRLCRVCYLRALAAEVE